METNKQNKTKRRRYFLDDVLALTDYIEPVVIAADLYDPETPARLAARRPHWIAPPAASEPGRDMLRPSSRRRRRRGLFCRAAPGAAPRQ